MSLVDQIWDSLHKLLYTLDKEVRCVCIFSHVELTQLTSLCQLVKCKVFYLMRPSFLCSDVNMTYLNIV